MENLKNFFSAVQKMENTKLERPTISEITDSNETKMCLLAMNLLTEPIFKISELNKLISEYGDSIIISTMPICKYNGDVFIMKHEFSVEGIISLIKNNEKLIIYNQIEGGKSDERPYNYRCAIIYPGGNVNDN